MLGTRRVPPRDPRRSPSSWTAHKVQTSLASCIDSSERTLERYLATCGLRRNVNLVQQSQVIDEEIKKQFWTSKRDAMISQHVNRKTGVLLSYIFSPEYLFNFSANDKYAVSEIGWTSRGERFSFFPKISTNWFFPKSSITLNWWVFVASLIIFAPIVIFELTVRRSIIA